MAVPISNVTRRVVYAASGTGPYAFTFEILANTDIAVYKDDTLLTLTTDYTVTIASNGTGSITLVASPTGATQIAIVGNRTIQRTTDFVTGGDFFANTVNDEMDQQTIFAQQNAEGLQRALSAPQTDPTTINMTLPRATLRANKALGFDADGNPAIADTLGTNRGNWAATTVYYVRDIVKDTTNNNIWQCITAHTSSGSQPINTNTDSAKWTLLVDAAAAAESASDAADSATAAASSASAASTSASSASTSASAASTSASGASTSATNAASSASSASSSASTASTAATNAGNSATAAATSATNASNSASAASTSASNASSSASAASTSASNASTSATNAASSATAASGSASTASTQATNAANSATSAAGSATSAASAQTAAEAARDATLAAYDSFDDRYLGAKTSDPSVDNDGNALVAGALYFNSVDGAMKLYTGSAWVAAYVSGSGYLASSNNLSDLANAATARTNLGLAIGTNVQAYDADLTSWAGIATSAKQDTLVSGTNIKTINSTSILGSGDISITSLGAGGASASGSVVLTAASAAMQLITSTALGQSVTLPDATTLTEGIPIFNIKNAGSYEMLILDGAGSRVGVIGAGGYVTCSLFDNSTAAGTWQISGIQYSAVFESFSLVFTRFPSAPIQYLEIDTGKHLFVLLESATDRIYGVVYDEATNTVGSATLIRALPGNPGSLPVGIAKISTTQVLIVSCSTNNNSTAFEAAVLGISGTTITVNTASTATLSANASRIGSPVQVGSSFVVPYARYGSSWTQAYRAMTVSGTTVTIGSEVAHSTADNTNFTPTIIPLSSTTFFGIGNAQGSAIQCLVGTVSGSSVSVGSTSNLSCTDSVPIYYARLLTTGRVSILYKDGTDLSGAIMSISGTSVSQSTLSLGTCSSSTLFTAYNIGDVFVAAWGASTNNNAARTLSDSSGTATAGALTVFGNSLANGMLYAGSTASELFLAVQSSTTEGTFYRGYISAGDIVFENRGGVVWNVAIGSFFTPTRTTVNQRASGVLVGSISMGSPRGGVLPALINGRATGVYNVPAAGFSTTTIEQTKFDKGWFVIDGETTTLKRMEMI